MVPVDQHTAGKMFNLMLHDIFFLAIQSFSNTITTISGSEFDLTVTCPINVIKN